MARIKMFDSKSGVPMATKAPRKTLLIEPSFVEKKEVKRHKCHYMTSTKADFYIRKYKTSTKLLIRRAPFQVVVVQIMKSILPGLRIQRSAIEALQEAAEAVIVAELEVSHIAAIHMGRLMVTRADMLVARRILGNYIES